MNVRPLAGLFGLLAFSALLFSFDASAVRWSNNFVEFELPTHWKCFLEGAEWVCQHEDEARGRDAIIILAAKLKGRQDTLDEYLKYLKKPKYYESVKGTPVKSTPKWAKMGKYNQHPWVDSMHLESEIPGFYTRYLATVKNDIAVLVTYSVNQSKYKLYRTQFESMVKTLKVFRKAGQAINAQDTKKNLFQLGSIPSNLQTAFSDVSDEEDEEDTSKKEESSDEDFYVLLGVLGLILVLFIIRRRKKNANPDF